MQKLRMVWFWIVAFSVIIWQTLKGNTWHSVRVDFHLGDNEYGNPERKQIIARRKVHGLDLFTQHMPAFVPEEIDTKKQ